MSRTCLWRVVKYLESGYVDDPDPEKQVWTYIVNLDYRLVMSGREFLPNYLIAACPLDTTSGQAH